MYRFEERRKFQRISIELPIDYRYMDRGEILSFLSKDVSARGMKIFAFNFIRPQTSLIVRFFLPDSKDLISALARVVWSQRVPHSENYFAGIEFLEIEDKKRRVIDSYVRQKRP